MSVAEAIRLIQIHERARQGRLRAKFMREIRDQEAKQAAGGTKGAPSMDHNVAAIKIQKAASFTCSN